MDWKETLRGIAPTIATMAGGPQVGVAVKWLGDKLLGKPDATEGEVSLAILNASPDERIKLTQLEQQFKVEMAKIGFDLEKMDQENVTARHATDMISDSWLSKNVRPLALAFLTVMVTLIAIGTLGFMDKERLPILQVWVQLFTSLLLLVYGFYFSSRGVEKIMKIVKDKGI